MIKKYLNIFILISAMAFFGIAIGSSARAEEEAQPDQEILAGLQFPIAELGNCQSREDCKVYCDQAENTDGCLAFAEDKNLMTGEELAAAKKFKDMGMKGPGGCEGKGECEKYCDNKDNMEACLNFAEEKGLMSGENLQEAKKVLTAVKSGTKPLGCDSRQECDDYCAAAEHMEECLNFGVEAGILPAQEQANARKVLTAIKNGAVRPACRGHECEVYCREGSEHAAECGSFAMAAGILSPPKMRQIQKILTAIEEGITLPGCSGEEECQDYCSQDANFEECVKFAEATEIITPEEATKARKTGGEGPGNCKTKEECDTFCDNLDNSEACFNFAKDNGLISEEDQKKIESSQQQMKESFNNMPAEALDCLTFSLGVETIEKLKSGNAMPGRKVAEKMEACLGKPGEQPAPPEAPQPPDQTGQNQGGNGEGQPGQQPEQPSQPGEQPAQPSQPSQPATGKCGDGKCGRAEQADPTLCPQDCGGSSQPSQPEEPSQQPDQPSPPEQPSQPGQPGQPPSPPSQPSQPGQPGQPPTPPSPPSPPSRPDQPGQQPTPPSPPEQP